MTKDSNVNEHYEAGYASGPSRWRDIGGVGKAKNLRTVCEGHTFKRVLDVGAGDGAVLKHLASWSTVEDFSAVELSKEALPWLRQLPRVVEVKAFDGYKIPFADGAFDLAFASHVVEHVEHPRLLLREMARVSRFQAFEVPCDYSREADANVAHFTAYGHINLFNPTLFRFLLISEGFTILRDVEGFYDPAVRRYLRFAERKTSLSDELRFGLSEARGQFRRRLLKALGRRPADAYTALCRKDGELHIGAG